MAGSPRSAPSFTPGQSLIIRFITIVCFIVSHPRLPFYPILKSNLSAHGKRCPDITPALQSTYTASILLIECLLMLTCLQWGAPSEVEYSQTTHSNSKQTSHQARLALTLTRRQISILTQLHTDHAPVFAHLHRIGCARALASLQGSNDRVDGDHSNFVSNVTCNIVYLST